MGQTRRAFNRNIGKAFAYLAFGGLLPVGLGYENVPAYPPRGTTIFLIDMQDFFVQFIPLSVYRRGLRQMRNTLRYASKNNLPVVQLEKRGGGKTIDALASLVKEVPRHSVVEHTEADSFTDSCLSQALTDYENNRLYLMGTTEVCVNATADGARRRGYKVIKSMLVLPDRLSLPARKLSPLAPDLFRSSP